MSDERKYWFFRSEVAGALAMWAVRQSPYPVPNELGDAVRLMHDFLPEHLAGTGMFGATENELRALVHHFVHACPIVTAWNQPKSGHTATLVFSSRYDHPAPDDDFTDLDALAGNVCRTLLNDQDDYELASGIEAATADETHSGSAEGESPTGEAGDAQPSPGEPS
jgi:hypothetical protein